MQVGIGYDSHRFIAGTFIMLGGIKIPFEKGIEAHSDGDVLLHAIGDALLGAAGLGDLGQHFPDSDPQFKSIASSLLLEKIHLLLKEHHFQIRHIDATVITELPKLKTYIPAIKENLAAIFALPLKNINIKAKTNEKMGWIGRGEGLAAQAIALISSSC